VTRKQITKEKTMHIQTIDGYNWPQEHNHFANKKLFSRAHGRWQETQ